LHGRQPVLPHRRIDRRTVGPFQATHDDVDLLVGRAVSRKIRIASIRVMVSAAFIMVHLRVTPALANEPYKRRPISEI
jgi:hypothetical protein